MPPYLPFLMTAAAAVAAVLLTLIVLGTRDLRPRA